MPPPTSTEEWRLRSSCKGNMQPGAGPTFAVHLNADTGTPKKPFLPSAATGQVRCSEHVCTRTHPHLRRRAATCSWPARQL